MASEGENPMIRTANAEPAYATSSMSARLAAAAVAFLAFFIAIYLGSFQAHLIPNVWDPVFGDGSEKVLLSTPALLLRKLILIPDAWMGAIAYLGAAVFAFAGPADRSRSCPWLVLLFGLSAIALFFASTTLVAVQGLVIGQWCLLCLTAAACTYTIFTLAAVDVFGTLGQMWEIWKTDGLGGVLSMFWDRAASGTPEQAIAIRWPRVPEAILGIWLAISAYFLPGTGEQFAGFDAAIGVLMVVLALASLRFDSIWLQAAKLGVSAIIVLPSYLYSHPAPEFAQNRIIVGLAFAIFALVPNAIRASALGNDRSGRK